MLDVVGLSWLTSICNITSGKVLLDRQPRVLNPLLKISDFSQISDPSSQAPCSNTVFTLAEEYSSPLLGDFVGLSNQSVVRKGLRVKVFCIPVFSCGHVLHSPLEIGQGAESGATTHLY